MEPDPLQSEASQWRVWIDPDSGEPWFKPPKHIDPDRKPRQHRRHRLGRLETELGAEHLDQQRRLLEEDSAHAHPGEGSAHSDSGEGSAHSHPDPDVDVGGGDPPFWPPGIRFPAPEDDPWHPDYKPPPRNSG